MQSIVLLPMVATIVALVQRSLAQVFLWVYLPVLLLLPTYFVYKAPLLPPFNFSEAVLLPLGLTLLYRLLPRWKFTVCDVWMGIYLLSGVVFHFQAHESTIAWFNLFHLFCLAFVPYALGKLLLEQENLRIRTVRQMVAIVAACCVVAEMEYFRGRNPFANFWSRFFPEQPLTWYTQMRWGFGRVAGPYGQSELAGMVIFATLILAIWVGYAYPWAEKFRWAPHPFQKRTVYFTLLVVALFTTQARGPWLGCLIAVPIALLGRTRSLLRNGLVLLLTCAVAGGVIYATGSRYTATQVKAATDEQQTAQYRRQLLDAYIPIAQSGGAWGLGEHFPTVPAAESIDNEYLFLWLVQGWVGLLSFVLIGGDTLIRLVRAIVNSRGKRDRFFALSLLGALCGMLLTIGTVFLSQQPYQIFFLLVGWSQSVQAATVRQEKRTLTFAHALR